MNTKTQIRFSSDFEVTGSPEFLKNFSSDLWVKKSLPSSSAEKNRAKRARKKSKK